MEARFVKLGLKDGFYNTALDEAIFGFVKENPSQPVVTLTEWKPTISLGNSQSYILDVNHEARAKHGIDFVRRRSGGKSVLLDGNYIVFSVISSGYKGLAQNNALRETCCRSIAEALQQYGIPAEFAPPDNVVVDGGVRTLGNSGQMFSAGTDCFYVHGSVRYDLPERDFETLMDVLQVDGEPLHGYRDQARKVLATVKEYSSVEKDVLAKGIVRSLAEKFLNTDLRKSQFSQNEEAKILEKAEELQSPEMLQDRSGYASRGVCYFFVGGSNLLPMKTKFNAPSA